MRKIYLLGTLLFAGLAFTACSDDDNNSNNDGNGLDPAVLFGTYKLVAVNTENPTDFNMDGTSSTNQMDETNCYDTAQITFSKFYDNFSFSRHFLAVSEEDGIDVCDDIIITGSWERISGGFTEGTFKLTYLNGEGNTRTMDIIKEGNTLRYINQYGPYPDRTSGGVPTTTAGSIEYVFTKITQ